MIDVLDLKFAYPDGRFSLSLDALEVPAGASLVITGPSGSGKTTLLHVLAGLLPARAQRIEVCGRDLAGLGDAARRDFRRSQIGLVFQDARLIDYLSVRDNILVGEHCAGLVRRMGDADARGIALATRLGLLHVLDQFSDRISQGEARRAAIARALLARPPLVLADEPTAGLDDDTARHTVDLLVATAAEQGATLVVASHDPRCVEACERRLEIGGLATRSAP